jgi:replicative DNA helicase
MTRRTREPPALSELVPMEHLSRVEDEYAALGCTILDGEGLATSLCSLLADEDYFSPDNRKVAETIRAMVSASEPVTAQTVASRMGEALATLGQTPNQGACYFSMLIRKACSSACLTWHCQQVLDASAQRSSLSAMYLGLRAQLKPDELREELMKAFDGAKAKTNPSLRPLATVADEQVRNLEERIREGSKMSGVPSGWGLVDWYTGGSFPTEVTIVGARPSVGKTAFLLQWAFHVAERGYRVLFVSLEMSAESLTHRILASIAGVEPKNMRCGALRPDDLENLADAKNRLEGIPFDIVDRAGMRVRDIHALARRLPEGQSVVFVDYIGLIRTDNPKLTREQQVSQISQQIKAAAKDTRIPWIVASQLHRLDDKRSKGNPKPVLSDLRESGSIEQDSDVVMLLHREDYGKDSVPLAKLEVILAKQRNGPTGIIPLVFHRPTQRILSDEGNS